MQVPQRLLSVRNKVYILKPLPKEKAPFTVTLAQITTGLLGLGTVGIMAYSAMVIASLFNAPTSSQASSTGLPSEAILPPIRSHAGSGAGSERSGDALLRPSTNANQRGNQIGGGRQNPFNAIRDLTVLLPGQVKWETPTPRPDQFGGRTGIEGSARERIALGGRSSRSLPTPGRLATPGIIPLSRSFATPGLPIPIATLPPAPPIASVPNPIPNFVSTPQPTNPAFQSAGPEFDEEGNIIPSFASATANTVNKPRNFGSCEIEVNGVLQTGGQPIVAVTITSADPAYSEPVTVGDRLCNGAVGVQSIIGLGGPQPMVVFDRYGQQITKPVKTNLVSGS